MINKINKNDDAYKTIGEIAKELNLINKKNGQQTYLHPLQRTNCFRMKEMYKRASLMKILYILKYR